MSATPIGIERIRGHLVCTTVLNDTPVILDIGAHLGDFSRILSGRINGKYVLVEPNPELYLNLPNRGPFTRLNAAVVGEDGPVSFNLARNPEASSALELIPEMMTPEAGLTQIKVAGISLRSLIEQLSLSKVDLIKLDIEGSECAVLESLSDKELCSIPQITVEFHDDPFFHFDLASQTLKIIRRLEALGFLFLRGEFPSNMDVLFLNRRFVLLTRNREVWLRFSYEWWPHLYRKINSYVVRIRGKLSKMGKSASKRASINKGGL